jgi:hypothetical protein
MLIQPFIIKSKKPQYPDGCGFLKFIAESWRSHYNKIYAPLILQLTAVYADLCPVNWVVSKLSFHPQKNNQAANLCIFEDAEAHDHKYFF